jgi:predicted enzyme related to lactoylglutathione lyase
MATTLTYTIAFVTDMDQAVRFYRDTIGLALKFQSPDWSEFATGDTTLALHPASAANPAGTVQLGFRVSDLAVFYASLVTQGVTVTGPPTQEVGGAVARFLTPDGAECSISGS